MKNILMAVILLVILMVHVTFAPFMLILGVRPDLMAVAIISFGLCQGTLAGVMCGFFGGVLLDALFGYPMGLTTGSYVLVGLLSGLAGADGQKGRFIWPVLICFLCMLAKGLIYPVYAFVAKLDFRTDVIWHILKIATATAIVMLVAYQLFYYLHKSKVMRRAKPFVE